MNNSKLEFNIKVGKRLEQIRIMLGLKKKEMAEYLDIDSTQYGKIEKGLCGLTLEKAGLLNNVLDVDINLLVCKEIDNNEEIDELLKRFPKEHREDMKTIIEILLRTTNSIY